MKNYAEASIERVTNNQDNVAINIKLKSGKKRFWFENVTAGVGDSDNETLYLAQIKLFYYSPEYSINLIADLNNVGEIALIEEILTILPEGLEHLVIAVDELN